MSMTEMDMLQTTPEGRAESMMPQVEGFLREQEAMMGEATRLAAPEGKFSARRLKALAKVLDKLFTQVEAPVSISMEYDDVQGPMPDELVKGLMVVLDGYDAFSAAMPEEVEQPLPELTTIVDDNTLAFFTATLETLMRSKEFRKFLREEEPTVKIDEEEEVIENDANTASADEVKTDEEVVSEEASILDML
tara:strand:- start:3175 stop:3750 length:576 start_codon:yes stop_codon:yes gene_type:complete